MSDDVETVLIGDDEDERDYPFSMIPVWVNYSGLSNAAYRLYATLRSLSIEGDSSGTRKLLDADLCELISRAQGKKIATRTLERWRDELVGKGLLKIDRIPVDTPGTGRPRMARRYRLVRYPRPGEVVVRSAWDLLRTIRAEREHREGHPLPPAVTFPTKMSENPSDPSFPTKMSGHPTKMSGNGGADLRQRAPKNPLKQEPSSSSPHPSTRLAARRGRGAGRRTEENKIKNFSHTHLELVRGLVLELPGGVDARQAEEITRLVCAALDRGWAPSAVIAWLAGSCDLERSKIPGAVHLHNARKLGDPSRAQSAKAVQELCPVCDKDGFTQDVSACSKDPLATPGLCLHGADDPWDDEEYRVREEAERAEALYAQQKAQQKAREERDRKARESARRAAQSAGEAVQRRTAAREFLEKAESLGDEDADAVRALLLTADDPADLDHLDDLVSLALGMLDTGSPVSAVAEVIATVPREEWKTAFLDRAVPAVA